MPVVEKVSMTSFTPLSLLTQGMSVAPVIIVGESLVSIRSRCVNSIRWLGIVGA